MTSELSFALRGVFSSMRRAGWAAGACFLGAVCCVGLGSCGSSGSDGGLAGMCLPGQVACLGNAVNVCSAGGAFVPMQTCDSAQVCDDKLGCVACLPNRQVCVGNELHLCDASGSIGALAATCGVGQTCRDGACLDACDVQASDLIYLVDDRERLLSFAPRDDKNTFKVIGTLNCPAGAAAPNSMAIDRRGRAWVNYDNGAIYLVNTQDASCQTTPYVPGQNGLPPGLGMGFVSDGVDVKTETLYVSSDLGLGKMVLSKMTTDQLALSRVGQLPPPLQQRPEMTGTGAAELYAYSPGTTATTHKITRVDQQTAQYQQVWQLPPLPAMASAWAFAHWGGRFYVFVTPQNRANQVYRYDPKTGMDTLILNNTLYRIVGAGVSTCAPLTL